MMGWLAIGFVAKGLEQIYTSIQEENTARPA